MTSSRDPGAAEDTDSSEVGELRTRTVTGPVARQPLPGRKVVFVIDDSEDARELYGDALRDAGYRVHEARDGREAQDLLLEHPTPTAIVLDLMMPIMDGFELLDLIRSYIRLLRIPTVVVSAGETEKAAALSIPYGAYLRKPIEGPAVVDVIERLVAARLKEAP
jgi:CheY-like chemotaxis protein